jgi:hypothetical protein
VKIDGKIDKERSVRLSMGCYIIEFEKIWLKIETWRVRERERV